VGEFDAEFIDENGVGPGVQLRERQQAEKRNYRPG
jgi:hypothetical protein